MRLCSLGLGGLLWDLGFGDALIQAGFQRHLLRWRVPRPLPCSARFSGASGSKGCGVLDPPDRGREEGPTRDVAQVPRAARGQDGRGEGIPTATGARRGGPGWGQSPGPSQPPLLGVWGDEAEVPALREERAPSGVSSTAVPPPARPRRGGTGRRRASTPATPPHYL